MAESTTKGVREAWKNYRISVPRHNRVPYSEFRKRYMERNERIQKGHDTIFDLPGVY